jgi:hypothetical protein
MYLPSDYFKYGKRYVESHNPPYDRWFILSAKHGLLLPTDTIEPYEKSLAVKGVKVDERRAWTEMVLGQFDALMGDRSLFPEPVTHADFYCGVKYREFLIPGFERREIKCEEPLKGLTLGRQLRWLKERSI